MRQVFSGTKDVHTISNAKNMESLRCSNKDGEF